MGWFGGYVLWLGFVIGFMVVLIVGKGGNLEHYFHCLAGMQSMKGYKFKKTIVWTFQ